MRSTLMTPEKLQARMRAGEQKRALEAKRNHDLYEKWFDLLHRTRASKFSLPRLTTEQWGELDRLIGWLASNGRPHQAERLNRLARSPFP